MILVARASRAFLRPEAEAVSLSPVDQASRGFLVIAAFPRGGSRVLRGGGSSAARLGSAEHAGCWDDATREFLCALPWNIARCGPGILPTKRGKSHLGLEGGETPLDGVPRPCFLARVGRGYVRLLRICRNCEDRGVPGGIVSPGSAKWAHSSAAEAGPLEPPSVAAGISTPAAGPSGPALWPQKGQSPMRALEGFGEFCLPLCRR